MERCAADLAVAAAPAALPARRVYRSALTILLCLPILGILQPTAAAEIAVFTVMEEAEAPQRALLRATPVVGGDLADLASSAVETTIELPGGSTIGLDQEMAWRLDLKTSGYWCEPVIVAPHQKSVTLKLVPTGIVKSRLQIPERENAEVVKVRFQSTNAGSKATRPSAGEVSCPVEDATWSCSIPTGEYDLRIRVDEYIAHYFWNLAVLKEQAVDLGILQLERGSSISGWVTAGDGLPLSSDCRVELMPMIAVDSEPPLRTRVKLHLLTEDVEKGFFHFEGVAPGSYVVSVHQEGYMNEKLSPVVVSEDMETEIGSISLERPLSLEVNLSPRLDLSENSWKLALLDVVSMEAAASGSADDTGTWIAHQLRPGNYLLFVSDSHGTRVAADPVMLDARRTTYSVELPIVWVEGEITLGEEPLAASLAFGGVSNAVSIKMDSDLEGRFVGWVPRSGLWDVDITSDNPKIFRRLTNVEVEPKGSGAAWLDFSLPDTVLEGDVVDDIGSPMPQADILILRLPAVEPPSYAKTDDQGQFAVHGYPPGEYRLEARARGDQGLLSSEPVAVFLAADAPASPVRLIMRRMIAVRGRVVSNASGIPGVSVRLSSLSGNDLPIMISPSTETNMEGRFILDVPRATRDADLTVLAPGFVLNRSRVTIDTNSELTVLLSREGGALIVSLRDRIDFLELDQPRVYVVHNGSARFDLGTLTNWARMNGVVNDYSRIVIPNMPYGSYSVCWSHRKRDSRPASPGLRCVDGFLPPSGELEVEVPSRD